MTNLLKIKRFAICELQLYIIYGILNMGCDNMVNSVKEAIDITMKAYNYPESARKQLEAYLLQGNMNYIIRENGARAYVQGLSIDQIREELYEKMIIPETNNSASFEDVIEDILKRLNIQQIDPNVKNIVFNELVKTWGSDYILQNGTRFTFDQLKDEMILSIQENKDTIYNQHTNLRSYDYTNLLFPVENTREALDMVIFHKNNLDQVKNAINQNPTLSRFLLDHALDYNYFKKERKDNFKQDLNRILKTINLSEKTLIGSIIFDNRDAFANYQNAEGMKEFLAIDKEKVMIELIKNSVTLYQHSSRYQNGISDVERQIYGGERFRSNIDYCQNNLVNNNMLVNSLFGLQSKNLSEQIFNLSPDNWNHLIELYVNSNRTVELQQIMDQAKTLETTKEVVILQNEIQKPELLNQLKAYKTKTY